MYKSFIIMIVASMALGCAVEDELPTDGADDKSDVLTTSRFTWLGEVSLPSGELPLEADLEKLTEGGLQTATWYGMDLMRPAETQGRYLAELKLLGGAPQNLDTGSGIARAMILVEPNSEQEELPAITCRDCFFDTVHFSGAVNHFSSVYSTKMPKSDIPSDLDWRWIPENLLLAFPESQDRTRIFFSFWVLEKESDAKYGSYNVTRDQIGVYDPPAVVSLECQNNCQ